MSKLHKHSRLAACLLARLSLSPLIFALVVTSIEKQNGQHSQCEEAYGKLSDVAQIRAHEDRE